MGKTLVLGASLREDRYSNMAVRRLKKAGESVVAFGLKKGTVAGVEIDTELQPYGQVDTVTLYINPERQKPYYDYMISLHPQRVIFNPGTENPELYRLLEKAGITVEVSCTLAMLATQQY